MSKLFEEFKSTLHEKIYEGKNLHIPRSRDPLSRKRMIISSSQMRDVFYNDGDIKYFYRQCETVEELSLMVQYTIDFYLKQKNKPEFNYYDRQVFFKYHALDSIQSHLLADFCQIVLPRPQDILFYVVSEIRDRMVVKLLQEDLNLRELRVEIQQLIILLNHINQDLIQYLFQKLLSNLL